MKADPPGVADAFWRGLSFTSSRCNFHTCQRRRSSKRNRGTIPGDAHFGLRGLLLATFAKPSANFTNSLPSFFAFVSGPWLKTDAGPRDGKTKNGEASNGVTYPDVTLTPVLKVTAGLEISSPAQVQESRPGQD
jgi:hypothetical protein